MSRASRTRTTLVELLVIVAGVLIALAVDEWRDSRRDLENERAYVERLVEDLQSDVDRLRSDVALLDPKLELLETLHASSEAESLTIQELPYIAQILSEARAFSWSALPTQRVTFDELLSTGSLALIRDTEVRRGVGEYYREYEFTVSRIIARTTEFPELSYRLVPRGEDGDHTVGAPSARQLARLGSVLRTGTFADAVTAETNRTMYQLASSRNLLERASALLQLLEDYLLR